MSLRHSIVAFTPRFARDEREARQFPPILGTGFVVHEAGIIATNDHVIRAIVQLPHPDNFIGIPASALLFVLTNEGTLQIDFGVIGVCLIDELKSGPAYYGPPKPDLGFVHVDVRGLLPVALKPHGALYEEGQLVATAGFPMGTDHLRAPGWLHQLSRTLQTGIISAVHPFPCATPHGFTISIMTQGGASGSPVFSPETGEVAGVVYAGLFDYDSENGQIKNRVPTTYTYAVPSHFIVNSLPLVLSQPEIKAAMASSKSIQRVFSERVVINALTGERHVESTVPW
jgi:S1-C subfamily serine protease